MRVEIGLTGNPSTGYGWEPDREPNDTSFHDPHPQPDDTPVEELLIGGEVIERFVFEDVPAGTNITFNYKRPWEKDGAPAKVVRIHVEEAG